MSFTNLQQTFSLNVFFVLAMENRHNPTSLEVNSKTLIRVR